MATCRRAMCVAWCRKKANEINACEPCVWSPQLFPYVIPWEGTMGPFTWFTSFTPRQDDIYPMNRHRLDEARTLGQYQPRCNHLFRRAPVSACSAHHLDSNGLITQHYWAHESSITYLVSISYMTSGASSPACIHRSVHHQHCPRQGRGTRTCQVDLYGCPDQGNSNDHGPPSDGHLDQSGKPDSDWLVGGPHVSQVRPYVSHLGAKNSRRGVRFSVFTSETRGQRL